MFNLYEDIIGAYHQGFTVQEIAECNDVDVQTVRHALNEHRAKMKAYDKKAKGQKP